MQVNPYFYMWNCNNYKSITNTNNNVYDFFNGLKK